MGVRASAADAGEQGRGGGGGFAADGLGIKAFILGDFKFAFGDLVVFDGNIQAGAAFDFGDFFKRGLN